MPHFILLFGKFSNFKGFWYTSLYFEMQWINFLYIRIYIYIYLYLYISHNNTLECANIIISKWIEMVIDKSYGCTVDSNNDYVKSTKRH